MSQPASERHDNDQVVRERAAAQVSDVLLNLEHTLARARKGLKIVAKDGVDVNAELALADLIKDLASGESSTGRSSRAVPTRRSSDQQPPDVIRTGALKHQFV